MLSAIDQAIDRDYKVVVFTGGEATLAEAQLLAGIKRASSRGVCTRLVTNCWWASDEVSADRLISCLLAAGLVEINFSTGDQHTRFVPVENVLHAVRAALKAKMRTICVMVELVDNRNISAASLAAHSEYKRAVQDYPHGIVRIIESPWMPMSASKVGSYPTGMMTNRSNIVTKTGCNSCLNTTTIQADGRIGACCGLGMRSIRELQLGHVRDTSIAEADERGADDVLKRWIRIEGPERILAWAATHDETIEWEDMYAHKCQACLRLYRDPKVRAVIQRHHGEKIPDIVFGEWLMFHYEDSPTEKRIPAEQHCAGEGVG
jgi:hypothetical protein